MVLLVEDTIDSILKEQFSNRVVTGEKINTILDGLTNPDSQYSQPDRAFHLAVRTYSPCSVRSKIASKLSDFYGANSDFGSKYVRLSDASCACVGCPHAEALTTKYKG